MLVYIYALRGAGDVVRSDEQVIPEPYAVERATIEAPRFL